MNTAVNSCTRSNRDCISLISIKLQRERTTLDTILTNHESVAMVGFTFASLTHSRTRWRTSRNVRKKTSRYVRLCSFNWNSDCNLGHRVLNYRPFGLLSTFSFNVAFGRGRLVNKYQNTTVRIPIE